MARSVTGGPQSLGLDVTQQNRHSLVVWRLFWLRGLATAITIDFQTEHLRKPADLFCYDNFSDRTVKCVSQTIFVCEPLGQDLRSLRVRYAI
jgi:hypothetical protein